MKSSTDGECGLSTAKRRDGCFDWTSLLSKDNGGPGEVPGRDEAVRAAKELSERKRRERGLRKKR